tara:strand:- start:111 stop:566 length:456 start_codon:yes stop_codon:yes gene_type:complete
MSLRQIIIRSLSGVKDTPERTSLAFSVGVFLGFSPFLGLHTVLALLLSLLFRFNKTAVLVGIFMNNPWIVLPYYSLATWFGIYLMGFPEGVSIGEIGFYDLLKAEFWYWVVTQWRLLIPACIGSSILSIILSLLSYPLALFLLRKHSAVRS